MKGESCGSYVSRADPTLVARLLVHSIRHSAFEWATAVLETSDHCVPQVDPKFPFSFT